MDENSVYIPNRKKVEELSEITNHKHRLKAKFLNVLVCL